MVVNRVNEDAIGLICLFLGHRFAFRMMYGRRNRKERKCYPFGYVSMFRVNGVPILPPILSEEEREECRMYRQQAIGVEKRINERKWQKLLEERNRFLLNLEEKVSEEQREEVVVEEVREEEKVEEKREVEAHDTQRDIVDAAEQKLSPKLDQSVSTNNSSMVVEIMDFIQKVLGDSHDLEEVKTLIAQVGEELNKRRSVGSLDSTCHDVDNISLNQNADLCSEAESNYFEDEDESECKSIMHVNDQTKYGMKENKELVPEHNITARDFLGNSDIVDQYIAELCSKDMKHVSSTPLLPSDEFVNDLLRDDGVLDLNREELSPNNSDRSEMNTPTKLIRSNSYTLESPSPSVLLYLRNLALEKESNGVPNKVVRNLNNHWDVEKPVECLATKTSEMLPNKPLENIPSEEFSIISVESNKMKLDRDDSDQENDDPQFEKKVDHLTLSETNIETEKMKAAITIQAAARSFLVRRLMNTQKVKDLKIIIKEAVLCAWSLYGEQAISPADIQLHERIIQQVTAACYELHSIFFNWSISERMALIRSDREKLKNPKPKFRISRERKGSDSDSVASSSRSKSASSMMSRSATNQELQRPTTLPSNPRRSLRYQHWSR